MRKYPKDLVAKIRKLRSQGKTYTEIFEITGTILPKGSISYICKSVKLPKKYFDIVKDLNKKSITKARLISAAARRLNKQRFLERIKAINLPIAEQIKDHNTAKIALAMLCLGEASKSSASQSRFALGNTDKRIIILFINLLKYCYDIDSNKFSGVVQCRADQNIPELEEYWSKISGIPKTRFYKAYVDKRTIGNPTLKPNYKGVFNVYYHDSKIQLDLECLADLLYNRVL